jgi:hypothetical protein
MRILNCEVPVKISVNNEFHPEKINNTEVIYRATLSFAPFEVV